MLRPRHSAGGLLMHRFFTARLFNTTSGLRPGFGSLWGFGRGCRIPVRRLLRATGAHMSSSDRQIGGRQ